MRILCYALTFSAWCVLWVFGVLEITRPLPGLISLKGSGGAYEMLRWFTGQPPWMVAVVLAVATFLLMWLPLKLLHWLDREGAARAALHWTLSSGSLNLLIFLLPAVLVMVGLLLTPRLETWVMTMMIAAVIFPLIALTPFAAFNPATLHQARLHHWWHMKWPGWRQVIVALLLIVVLPVLTGFVTEALADDRSWPITVGIESLGSVIDIVAEILAVVNWLSFGRREEVRSGLARISNARFLRAYLGYSLMIGLLVLPFAVPILVHSAYFAYAAPQYDDWAQRAGAQMPWAIQVFSSTKQLQATWAWLSLGLPATALSLLCLGRLLAEHGVGGLKPDTAAR
ncbi:MAG: hypothetical protein WAZ48_01365 [Lysobacteraceae bacterium]